jgi:YidC/Oxa1 family membrane protein insertase
MEKRFFLAFLITFIFLIFWSRFVSPPTTPPPTLETQEVSETPEQEPLSPEHFLPEETAIGKKQAEFSEQTIGDFHIIYSPLGGYIKEISFGIEHDLFPFGDIGFMAQDKDTLFTADLAQGRLKFVADGRKKEFIFGPDTITIKQEPAPGGKMVLFSKSFSSKMLDINQRYQEVFYSQNNLIKRAAPPKMKAGRHEDVDFAGARDRYFCLSLIKGQHTIEWVKSNDSGYLYLPSPPGEISLYFGPQTEDHLKEYGLSGVVYYGFFHSISLIMIKVIYIFYALTKSWGLTIICFSIAINFLLFPFTAKSMKAMRKIQQVQPELEELKEKYKDNPQKQQREIMEFYRKHKINPLGGCLPLFFQFPIFIALYQVIFRLFDLKGAQFLWIKDLSLPDRLFSLPFTIPLLNTDQFNLLPILVMLLGIIQQRITTTSKANSQQKMMSLFMSVFIGFIFYGFPSALVLYWFTQSFLTLVYQARLARTQAP